MKQKLPQRGKNLILPIIGHDVSDLRLGINLGVRLLFTGPEYETSEIQFEEKLYLTHGNNELIYGNNEELLRKGTKHNSIYKQEELCHLVKLLGSHATEAFASKEGILRLSFANKFVITVTPFYYEGWHFQSSTVDITGDDGRLLVFYK